MIGTYRKNKITEELITVRGTKQLVTYANNYPMHTFIKVANHKGIPCYKGYMNFKSNPKFTGYYVIDIIDKTSRLFSTFKSKRMQLVSKCELITWDEWLLFNQCSNIKLKK